MMAYIQILSIVLCSCFIQDAFSTSGVTRVKSFPANGMAALKTEAAVGPTKVVRRTVSRKAIEEAPEAIQEAPEQLPPPPPQYPHLSAVKDMFWSTLEDINRSSNSGKLNARAVRNTMNNVLRNQLFWMPIVRALKRNVKVVNDPKRADGRIRMCNTLTGLITDPDATRGFEGVANEVYGTVSRMQSELSTNALQLVNEMVSGGEVTRALDTITSLVKEINLSPTMLVKGFAMLRKTLNLGGMMNMSGGMAKSLMSITSKFK